MVITMLTADAEGNVADWEDCDDWADRFYTDHPILADDQGFAHAVMGEGEGFPFYMLVEPGMYVKKIASGAESITDEEILAELPQE